MLKNTPIWTRGSKLTLYHRPGASDFGPGASDFGPGASDFGPGASDFGPGAKDFGPGAKDFGPGASKLMTRQVRQSCDFQLNNITCKSFIKQIFFNVDFPNLQSDTFVKH